jgi:hypothetical protein
VSIDTLAAAANVRARHGLGSKTAVRSIAAVVAISILLVVLGLGAHAWIARRNEIDRTTAAVSATRLDIARSRVDLALARRGLATAQEVLDGTRAALNGSKRERDAVAQALVAAGAELTGLQTELAAATADLQARRAQLDVLGQCLLGVAQALNQAGAGDLGGLARTVQRTEGTCARAGASS